jgi:hypothetical protein
LKYLCSFFHLRMHDQSEQACHMLGIFFSLLTCKKSWNKQNDAWEISDIMCFWFKNTRNKDPNKFFSKNLIFFHKSLSWSSFWLFSRTTSLMFHLLATDCSALRGGSSWLADRLKILDDEALLESSGNASSLYKMFDTECTK